MVNNFRHNAIIVAFCEHKISFQKSIRTDRYTLIEQSGDANWQVAFIALIYLQTLQVIATFINELIDHYWPQLRENFGAN